MQKIGIFGLLILVAGCTNIRDENNYYTVSNPAQVVNYSISADDSPPVDETLPSDNSSSTNDSAAAIQQMNDENSLNSSMQAAEQQNEAAQAAATQDEINENFTAPLPYN